VTQKLEKVTRIEKKYSGSSKLSGMAKIALLGYGKMGKAIERLALDAGDEIVLRLNADNEGDLTGQNLKHADVAIDFSHPDTGFKHI